MLDRGARQACSVPRKAGILARRFGAIGERVSVVGSLHGRRRLMRCQHDYAFSVFAAEPAETVARVCADAGAPAERISAAIGWSNMLDY
jgi:hypothetical protein